MRHSRKWDSRNAGKIAGEHDVIGSRNRPVQTPDGLSLFDPSADAAPGAAPAGTPERMRSPAGPPAALERQTPPHANQTTSKRAAERYEPKAGTAAARVDLVFRQAGTDGLTRREAFEGPLSDMDWNVLTPRILSLLEHGRLKETTAERQGGYVLVHQDHVGPCPTCQVGNPKWARGEICARCRRAANAVQADG